MQSFQELIKPGVRRLSCELRLSCEQIRSLSYEPLYLFVSALSGAGNQSSEWCLRDFGSADFVLCTHRLLEPCTGGQRSELRQLGQGPLVCNVENKRQRKPLFIGDDQLGLDGPLIHFRSQQLSPAIICLSILLISSIMTVKNQLCFVFPYFGILRGTCNLVALLPWDLLLAEAALLTFVLMCFFFWWFQKHISIPASFQPGLFL